MELLEKFDAVVIETDSRISELDKEYCEAHQKAYDDARTVLAELKIIWETMLTSQKEKLERTSDSATLYLTGSDKLSISLTTIQQQIRSTHVTFIDKIVRHFNGIYHVTISEDTVEAALLPEKPERSWRRYNEEEWEKYEQALDELELKYQDIVDKIFEQMDGRGLWEQAVHELKEQCHNGSWNFYNEKPRFERKKTIIQFSNSADSSGDLVHSMKNVIRGLAHYETGVIGIIPTDFTPLFDYHQHESYEFSNCKKTKKIRIFRNGRVDIRFVSEEAAQTFINEYLGTVY